MNKKIGAFSARIIIPFLACSALFADNVLHPGTAVLDRPTITVLGVKLPITGDDNFNASVTMQYKVSGATAWQSALPLFRVHPETVAGYTVAPQFGGSIFDLKPATTYDIQLHITDPDGVDQTVNLTGTTRAVPGDPAAPNYKNVSGTAALQSALAGAQPGDVITLANGTYSGTFQIGASGTAANPIVIRGATRDGVILDGQNCNNCNVVEVYGSYVHVEQLTIQDALRAIRFQGAGSIGNVLRNVHTRDTNWGIGSQPNQLDYYIADNTLEGRLKWPLVNADDGGVHASDDGIAVQGFGHVVTHNQISGFGDAMKINQDGSRADDFYGNLILYTYDNGVELDGGEGNVRCFRNLFMNTYATISVQPVHGGPAYIFRNVVVNVVSEQLKFHALAISPPEEPSGVLVYNNTFVSASGIPELDMETPASSHYFAIENNIFVGAGSNIAANWTGPIDHGTFDYNAYSPDGIFAFNNPLLGGYFITYSFAQLQAKGMEPHGFLTSANIFASGLVPPSSYTMQLPPSDAMLAAGANVLDKALPLANINDHYSGAGPDLGALELGCPEPTYGPRTGGVNETNEVTGCTSGGTVTPPTASAVFRGADSTTQGNWTAVYGTEGYSVAGDVTSAPAYGNPVPDANAAYNLWAAAPTDPRALMRAGQRAAVLKSRIAATWYADSSFVIDSGITDTATHEVALYCLDWDLTTRHQKVEVLDASGNVLDTQVVSAFHNGLYLVWNVTGHVKFRVTNMGGLNAVISGVFFGGKK